MAWVGRTNFSEIGVGTSLRLEEIPTIPGRSPSPVRARSKIDIEMAAGVRTKATIVSVYPVHVMTRKSFGLMMRKLSVTESQRSAQFPGTFSRRKLSVASANWAQVA